MFLIVTTMELRNVHQYCRLLVKQAISKKDPFDLTHPSLVPFGESRKAPRKAQVMVQYRIATQD